MKEFQVNSTTYVMQIFMADSADGKTGKTGLTVSAEISKNGGAFAAAAGAVTEIGYGWYALAGNATDRDTLGKLALHATAAGADAFDAEYDIVTHDPYTYGGNLDATVTSRMAADDYVDHTAAIAAVQATADDIETAVGALVAPDNTTIGAIDAAVTALAGVVDGIDTRVPADPASDTTVLTRMATADYVAPDNAVIAAIEAAISVIDTYLQDDIAKATEVAAVKAVVDGLDARLPVDPVGDTTMNARFDVVDTAIGDIPADTWAYTGVRALTTQNVSVVNDPVLEGFDSVYQHTLLMAIPCFWQREYTIPNGDTIDFTVYLRKNVSMAYLPRVWVFKTGTEPLIDGTYLLQEDVMPSDSIDTWEEMTLSYTNNTGVEDVFTIRILASNVGGSVFSQMETDYSVELMESSFGITVYPRDNSIYP